jgi:hypothetical protein
VTKEELITKLKELLEESHGDCENTHVEADEALLEFINDPEITEAFGEIEKWYA